MQNHNSFPSSGGSHPSWSPWSSPLSMTRRCSHCSNNGHNTRTCPTRSHPLASASSSPSLSSSSPNSNHNNGGWVKLFGVRLNDGSFIKKSASMGNLSSALHSSNNHNNSDSPSSDHPPDDGYLSDDPNNHAASSSSPAPAIRRMAERKKGVPWTEEEHRLFLIGLKKLGKGDWRGIARNFVVSRTPTQVASHAQKYFIRHFSATRRKRRSSLFDMVPDMAMDPRPVPEELELLSSQARETNNADVLPLKSEYEPMETVSRGSITEPEKIEMGSNESEPNVSSSNEYVPIFPLSSEFIPYVPGFFPAYASVSYPFWPANTVPLEEARVPQTSQHQVLKPVPILPKDSVNVDELVGISHLSLGDTEKSHREPSPLSLKLVGEASRQSAFHANASVNGSGLSKGKAGAIQAI